MNDTAIAMQQPKVQETTPQPSSSGVVNKPLSDDKKFDKVLKTLLKDSAKQAKGEKDLVQILEDNGEENAQELAAQLMAQNPMLIAMILANSSANGTRVEDALAQLTQSTQQVTNVATVNMQELITNATVQEPAQQPTVAPNEVFNATIMQAVQNQQAAQAAQPQAEIAQEQIAQPIAAAQEGITATMQNEGVVKMAEGVNAKVVQTEQASQKEQPQQLAQKADFDSIAQKLKLDATKTQQGTHQEPNSEGGESNSAKSQETKEQKLTDSGVKQPVEQAMPAEFSKQINEIKPVKEAEVTVKNQSSQEVIRQTVEGIKQNVAKGKEEFVMKLTPEGLGEITVKLVSENGHTTMQLTAQSQSIQRILGAELEALQQAVRPYNVEVKEVTTANQSQLDMNMSNQNNPQQQYQSSAAGFFYNQQQGGKGQQAQQGYLTRSQITELAGDDNIQTVQKPIQGTAINLHI